MLASCILLLQHSSRFHSTPPWSFNLAIVGRSNVGKSSFFNRLIGAPSSQRKYTRQKSFQYLKDHFHQIDPIRPDTIDWKCLTFSNPTLSPILYSQSKAIVHPYPGVTRDLRFGQVQPSVFGSYGMSIDPFEAFGVPFTVCDTPGVDSQDVKYTKAIEQWKEKSKNIPNFFNESEYSRSLKFQMLFQTDRSLDESHVALFILDGRQGITNTDKQIARWLHTKQYIQGPKPFNINWPDLGQRFSGLNFEDTCIKGFPFESKQYPNPFSPSNLPIILGINKTETFNEELAEEHLEFYLKQKTEFPTWESIQNSNSFDKKMLYNGFLANVIYNQAPSLGFGTPTLLSATRNQGFEQFFQSVLPYSLFHLHEYSLRIMDSLAANETLSLKSNPSSLNNNIENTDSIESEGLPQVDLAITSSAQPISPSTKSIERGTEIASSSLPISHSAKSIDRDHEITVAIVGRPNVGKSSILNSLLGENRSVAGPTPGMTRDPVPIIKMYKDYAIRIIDTAGIRPQASVDNQLEKLSIAAAHHCIKYANVVVVVVDLSQGHLTAHELSLCKSVIDEGRSLIVLANKADLFIESSLDHEIKQNDTLFKERSLVPYQESEAWSKSPVYKTEHRKSRGLHLDGFRGKPEKDATASSILQSSSMLPNTTWKRKSSERRGSHNKENHLDPKKRFLAEQLYKIQFRLNKSLPQGSGASLLHCSALYDNTTSISRIILDSVIESKSAWSKKISTKELNTWLHGFLASYSMPKGLSIRFMTQTNTGPPSFVIYVNLGPSLRRTIMNHPSSPPRLKAQLEKIKKVWSRMTKEEKKSSTLNVGTTPLDLGEAKGIDVTRFLPKTFLNFLTNGLRKQFGFSGVPIRIWARSQG